MMTHFKYTKTIALGNIDKRHQYETETFEATSDVSFEEAMLEVNKQVVNRIKELIILKDKVDTIVNIKTRE